jgi:nucleotide-binding universal stress UspA family protein
MAAEDRTEPVGRPRAERRIVVGIDGSDESLAALAFAFDEAELRHAQLDVVYAWGVPYLWAEAQSPDWTAEGTPLRQGARLDADRFVDSFLAGAPRPPWVHVTTVQDDARNALLASAEGAELLVVGSRGRGGFSRLLLGSVSSACVRHSPGTVAVVRPRRTPS